MFAFAFVWPWIGLGAAGLLLILLTTNVLRSDRSVTRWRDMTWLTWAATCAAASTVPPPSVTHDKERALEVVA